MERALRKSENICYNLYMDNWACIGMIYGNNLLDRTEIHNTFINNTELKL